MRTIVFLPFTLVFLVLALSWPFNGKCYPMMALKLIENYDSLRDFCED